MKKNSIISLFTLLALTSTALADDEVIRSGVKALTSHAIQGPSVDCADETLALSKKFSDKGADCSGFVNSEGKFGPRGKIIVNHINSMGSKALFYRKDLLGAQLVCPNWANLSNEQRAYFWVWFIAGLSWKETTCGANTVNSNATHGTAVGLLQMNQNRSDRHWRGGSSGNSCAVANVKPDDANLKCGLEILNEQLKGQNGIYEGNGALYGRSAHAYWQDIRRSNSTVIRMMADFPPCKR